MAHGVGRDGFGRGEAPRWQTSRGSGCFQNPLKRSNPVRTAQGGGGSFKDRKPIGAVGLFCDAWMAEQSH